ncbi:MAG TPA: hypothetical protein VIU64_14645 [Polyangia bacterium]
MRPQIALPARWRDYLAAPRARLVIAGVAVLLVAPSLRVGLVGDDLLHALMLRPEPGLRGLARSPLDLFSFATGQPSANHALMDEGVFPWWADPHARLSFWRPLSSLTHWLDHRLFPDSPALMHAHNLLWYGALLLVVGLVYRRFLGRAWYSGLALLLYAVDHARGPTVGWIANRNALIALTLALPALISYDRACRGRDRRAAVLGPVFLGLGLMAGETALTVVAYLVAYALWLDRGPWWSRLRRLGPCLTVVLIWRLGHLALGHGADGSGLYFDPGRDPWGFATAVLERLPPLILAAFALPFSDFWDVYPLIAPGWRQPIWLLGIAVGGAVVVLLRPLAARDRTVGFWAVGCVLATLPVCAPFPNDRLLMGPSLGAMALVARLLGAVADGDYPAPLGRQGAVRAAAALLAILHLALSPVLLPLRARAVALIDTRLRRADASIPATEAITGQTLVLVNPPIDPFAGYFPIYRAALDRPAPRRFRWLATGVSELDIERVGARALRVRPAGGYLASSSQLMLRSPRRPFTLGETVSLTGVTFEVTALTSDGRPAEVEVRFAVPLEDPSLRFMQWDGADGYVPFEVPPPGRSVHVPAVDVRRALFG